VLARRLLPVVTLAVIGDDMRNVISGPGITGRYVVDNFALVLKALFLLSGYVVVLLSTNEIEEGGYYQGEYYVLLLSSVLGMVMIASSRDLVSCSWRSSSSRSRPT
jgi:NADH-quinone oxidoreductase subunit N